MWVLMKMEMKMEDTIELNTKMAKIVADDALKMIGEKKSIRKETFQEIAKSVAPKIY